MAARKWSIRDVNIRDVNIRTRGRMLFPINLTPKVRLLLVWLRVLDVYFHPKRLIGANWSLRPYQMTLGVLIGLLDFTVRSQVQSHLYLPKAEVF